MGFKIGGIKIGGDVGNFLGNPTKSLGGAGKFLEKGLGDVGRFMGLTPEKQKPYEVTRSYFEPGQEEKDLVQQLVARSQGKMPSLAEVLLQRGIDQANANAQAMAASQRGIDPALAARMAAQAQAFNMQQGAQTAAGLRAEEQANAESRLAQALQSIRAGRMAGEQLQAGATTSAREASMRASEGAAGRRFNFLGNLGKGMSAQNFMGMLGGSGAAAGGGFGAAGGGAGGLGEAGSALMVAAKGGEVPHYAAGGFISRPDAQQPMPQQQEPGKIARNVLGGISGGMFHPNLQLPNPTPAPQLPPLTPQQVQKREMLAASSQLPKGINPEMLQAIEQGPAPIPNRFIPGRMSRGFNPFGRPSGSPLGSIFHNVLGLAEGGAVEEKEDPFIVDQGLMNMRPMDATGFMTAMPQAPVQYDSETAAKMALLKSHGGPIPGHAKHEGDHYDNDTVPAMLSPGEIVLPRSVAQDEDAPELAKEFVAQIKKQKKSKEEPSYAKVLAMNHMMNQPSDQHLDLMAILQNRAKGLA